MNQYLNQYLISKSDRLRIWSDTRLRISSQKICTTTAATTAATTTVTITAATTTSQ